MPHHALRQLCDLVSDVAITNATKQQQTFCSLVSRHSISLEPEFLLKTFAFMNWTFAQGVWSNLHNIQLRRDLQIELKDSLIMKLACQISGSDSPARVAAKFAFLTEDFNAYLLRYKQRVQELGYADSGTAKLFAIEQIQEECQIGDALMNDIVPNLWADDKSNSMVESVAMQVNNVAAELKPSGFLRKLFGRRLKG